MALPFSAFSSRNCSQPQEQNKANPSPQSLHQGTPRISLCNSSQLEFNSYFATRFDALWTSVHVSAGLHPMASPFQAAWTARHAESRHERAFPGEGEPALEAWTGKAGAHVRGVPGERGRVGAVQTLRGLGNGSGSCDSNSLEGFYKETLERTESRGMAGKRAEKCRFEHHIVQSRIRMGFFVYCLLSKARLRQP